MNLQETIRKVLREEINLTLKNDVISKNVTDPTLIKTLIDIQKLTGEDFTQQHFDNEKKISGGEKKLASGLNQNALNAFKKLQQVCKGLTYDEDSYRTYKRQAQLFIEYIEKYGSIDGAMSLRAIPGFSQHHTGKAFDVEQYGSIQNCVAKRANKFGFIFPYAQEGIRQAEPWHIYYNK